MKSAAISASVDAPGRHALSRHDSGDFACDSALSVLASDPARPRWPPQYRVLPLGRPRQLLHREVSGREAALNNQKDLTDARVSRSGGTADAGLTWIPWSQVWRLIPGQEDLGFKWEILGRYDPQAASQLTGYIEDGAFKLRQEHAQLNKLMKRFLPDLENFTKLLHEALRTGKIEAQGHEERVSAPMKEVRPEYWDYWQLGAGPLLAESIVVLGDTKWYGVEVRLRQPAQDVLPGLECEKRQRTPKSLEISDIPLLFEMKELRRKDKSLSVWGAALAVEHKAKGSTEKDAAKFRLNRKYKSLRTERDWEQLQAQHNKLFATENN